MSPRLLAIIGSGETAPSLARVHRSLVESLGGAPVPAAVIDTPYGFQENADDISGRALDYFRETVGNPFALASFRSADVDAMTRAAAVARIREARLVFSGPGSPSYALRQWAGSDIPGLLAEKLATDGAVVFASAAALTLGALTVPVYEIYKVGEAPHWLPGLDLLGTFGLRVAVIPHYDNAEGGNHDTRFCYLGERRLRVMEAQLPDDVFVLGIDGHTALLLDLVAGTATVSGLGGVTVRRHGHSTIFSAGTSVPIDALRDAAARADPGSEAVDAAPPAGRGGSNGVATPELAEEVRRIALAFDAALARRDAGEAVRAILELDGAIVEWSRDTGPTADYDQARGLLHACVVRLGELAVAGTRDPRSLIAPFVEELLALRAMARERRDWATSDTIRRRLVDAGIEVHDAPAGTSWGLVSGEPGSS